MKTWKIIYRLAKGGRLLGLYLDDLLMAAGGTCLVAAAALRWGAAAGLAAAGVCLIVFSILVARSGRR